MSALLAHTLIAVDCLLDSSGEAAACAHRNHPLSCECSIACSDSNLIIRIAWNSKDERRDKRSRGRRVQKERQARRRRRCPASRPSSHVVGLAISIPLSLSLKRTQSSSSNHPFALIIEVSDSSRRHVYFNFPSRISQFGEAITPVAFL